MNVSAAGAQAKRWRLVAPRIENGTRTIVRYEYSTVLRTLNLE